MRRHIKDVPVTISVSFGRSILDNPMIEEETTRLDVYDPDGRQMKMLLDNTRNVCARDRDRGQGRGFRARHRRAVREGCPSRCARSTRRHGSRTPRACSGCRRAHPPHSFGRQPPHSSGNGRRADPYRSFSARSCGLQYCRARRGQYVPPRQGGEPGTAAALPRTAGCGPCPLSLLYDRAGRGRRRGLRSDDDADNLPPGRQPLGDQRAQDLHHRRRRRRGSGS